MKHIIIALCVIGVCLPLRGEVVLGAVGSIGFGLDTRLQATSNVILDSTEQDDVVTSAMPKVVFRSAGGAAAIEAFAGVDFLRYDQLSKNDADNFKSGLSINYPAEPNGEPISLQIQAGFNQNTSASAALLAITETESLTIGTSGTVYLSQYVSIRSAINYTDTASKTAGFADTTSTTLPLSLYYRVDEAISIGTGYRYRNTSVGNVQPAADSDDHAVFVGFENLISPLLQYGIELGYQKRDFANSDVFKDERAAYAQALLTWFLNERTNILLAVSNEFGTTAANQSNETFSTTLTLIHNFDERLSTTIGGTYQDLSYTQAVGSRSDDETSLFLNTRYSILDDKVSLNGGFSYADHQSSITSATYEVLEATVSCTVLF